MMCGVGMNGIKETGRGLPVGSPRPAFCGRCVSVRRRLSSRLCLLLRPYCPLLSPSAVIQ